MLAQTQDEVESNPRVVAGALVNGNTVDDVGLTQIFERPEEMLRSNTEHRRADADAGIERNDFVVPQFLAEAIDEVDFGADGPLGACGRSLDGFDDALGRADLIGGLRDFETAFGMRNDANAGMLAANALDLLRREALVHGAVTLPEDDARAADRLRRVSAKFLVGIPDDHLFERDAHAIAGVAAEVLVGEEKNFFTRLESPPHDLGGVGTGADRAALLAREGFDGRGRSCGPVMRRWRDLGGTGGEEWKSPLAAASISGARTVAGWSPPMRVLLSEMDTNWPMECILSA